MKKKRPLASVEWRIIGYLRDYHADTDAKNAYDLLTHGRTPTDIQQAPEIFIDYVPCTLTKEEYDAMHSL